MSTMVGRRKVRRSKSDVRPHSRHDVTVATLGAAGVVAFTVFGIWALRPGGLAHHQPRATTLVSVSLVLVIMVVAFAIRPPSPRSARRRRTWVPTFLVIIVVGSTVLWLVWPGGMVRHGHIAIDLIGRASSLRGA